MILQTVLALCLVPDVLGSICCTPKQWEGTKYTAVGFAKGFRHGQFADTAQISYDAKGRSLAASGTIFRKDQEKEYKVIYNFANSKGYYILPKERKCKSYNLKRKFREACIPDEAKNIGESYYGAGTNTLDVTAYLLRFTNESRRTNIAAVGVVTREGCIPVTEDLTGTYRGVDFFKNANFAGIAAGIKDPTVFSPPEYCDEGTVVEMIDDQFYEQYSMLQFTHPGVAWNPEDRASHDEDMAKMRHPVF